MKISILSGKGGTGKTTVSTNLSYYMALNDYSVHYWDFDVEEPNGFIFLNPEIAKTEEVLSKVPKIDENLCTKCGDCAKYCNFNALAITKNSALVFEKLCHDCGLCYEVCPVNAISEITRPIGQIKKGYSEKAKIQATSGFLSIQEPTGVPIIKKMKKQMDLIKEIDGNPVIHILDAPPGSSCTVLSTVKGSDFSLLITEPTKFGLHDLKIAVSVLDYLSIPYAVVINKSNEYDSIIEDYCNEENIEIMGKIPFSKEIAKNYSKGNLLVDVNNENLFTENIDLIFSNLKRRLNL
ncbi:P-loop NTPase [Methanococcus voltae]|uniref:Cobyrinic acid ac-diamide synthase n=1 Tax=Methanococcus voltae (strain ATCC BAA-1334 / A3) TaxID=456320 RepID=D7DT91_METV3|nr:ATP-binding protein [Methanococcus voltae]MCS3901201.1 MinD superfamily P-loop ATPase [Methanococcus voltae]